VAQAVDTSILVRQADVNSPDRPIALGAIARLAERGETLQVFAQNMMEFWVVATRPQAVNGLGLSIVDTDAERKRLERLFLLLSDPPDLCARWITLVDQFGVSGNPAHDARIVAATLAHGLTHILTFNSGDFKRYTALGIVAIDSAQV